MLRASGRAREAEVQHSASTASPHQTCSPPTSTLLPDPGPQHGTEHFGLLSSPHQTKAC
ncbi:hypothetical protein BGZ61DRAFT_460633 [Ilyonectria robusta]|uniref:uncharacterized protein n=1 Tax=Ilyonectria robusta TaxID=1079257 RepID=UPI001E8CB767|nr:uncharacterized protein BGZ61DRAFT_460633 [Ilyonectria robusta]KAH8669254.1 hypothetical protein BGZ61DRAFT_460633 [Ilyonectria robusta]